MVGGGNFRRGLSAKVLGGLSRSWQLRTWVRGQGRPEMLVSSSRSASVTARLLSIPAIAVLDYEHASQLAMAAASRIIWMPDLIRGAVLPFLTRRVVRFFQGLKENLYLDSWRFEREELRRQFGFGDTEYVVISRPPAVTAHYASAQSWPMWVSAMRLLMESSRARIVISPRSEAQAIEVDRGFGQSNRCQVMRTVTPGPSMIAAADLVLGGGGTMNREAAVLGVPAWSVFTGPAPRIDDRLANEGRLRWLRTGADLQALEVGSLPGLMPGRGPFPSGLRVIQESMAEVIALRKRTS